MSSSHEHFRKTTKSCSGNGYLLTTVFSLAYNTHLYKSFRRQLICEQFNWRNFSYVMNRQHPFICEIQSDMHPLLFVIFERKREKPANHYGYNLWLYFICYGYRIRGGFCKQSIAKYQAIHTIMDKNLLNFNETFESKLKYTHFLLKRCIT